MAQPMDNTAQSMANLRRVTFKLIERVFDWFIPEPTFQPDDFLAFMHGNMIQPPFGEFAASYLQAIDPQNDEWASSSLLIDRCLAVLRDGRRDEAVDGVLTSTSDADDHHVKFVVGLVRNMVAHSMLLRLTHEEQIKAACDILNFRKWLYYRVMGTCPRHLMEVMDQDDEEA